jgi:hypothetical protein
MSLMLGRLGYDRQIFPICNLPGDFLETCILFRYRYGMYLQRGNVKA